MAICLRCSKTSTQCGELCPSCKKAYTVKEDHGKDPIGLLGKLLINKFIPICVLFSDEATVTYEAVQLVVDRTVTLTVLKPAAFADNKIHDLFSEIVKKYAGIKQQNVPNLLEVVELKEEKTVAISSDAPKGELLCNFLERYGAGIDPVVLMHIAHQAMMAVSTLHQKGILFPHFGMDHIRIMRSGGDESFVKICGVLESNLVAAKSETSPRHDVYDMAQLVLSLISGQKPPIKEVSLPEDRAFMMPIAELFLKATKSEHPYPTCVELLKVFEMAFNLKTPEEPRVSEVSSQEMPVARVQQRRQRMVPFEQIIWMHQPPQHED